MDVVVEVRVLGRGQPQKKLANIIHQTAFTFVDRHGRGSVTADDMDPPFHHPGLPHRLSKLRRDVVQGDAWMRGRERGKRGGAMER